MLQAMDWKHLPDVGGILDQDEALMQDLTIITWRLRVVEMYQDASTG